MNLSETHNINQMKGDHEYLQVSAENYMFSHYSDEFSVHVSAVI